MLKYRIITALVLIPLVIAALFLLPLQGFAWVTLLICVLGAWEWAPLAGFKALPQRILITTGFFILLSLSLLVFFLPWHTRRIELSIIKGMLWLVPFWWLIALGLVLFYPRSANLWRGSRILPLLFGLLTLLPFFFGMLVLRQSYYSLDPSIGAWWLLYVMVLVWGADSGAYLFGKRFGKHKLAPSVSPGKTWEGLIGGLLTSVLISWVFGRFAPLDVLPTALLISSVLATLASVLGDLTESMLKREAGIKDSGHLLPGHGGILDRIDSLLAAIPIFACLRLLMF